MTGMARYLLPAGRLARSLRTRAGGVDIQGVRLDRRPLPGRTLERAMAQDIRIKNATDPLHESRQARLKLVSDGDSCSDAR